MKSILIGMMVCFIALNSHAASFDCSKAGTFIEKAICADTTLSKLDELLLQAYKKARAESKDPKSIKKQQRAWLKKVRNKCQDPECLQRVYEERIIALGGTIPNDSNALWQGEWNRVGGSQHEGSGLSITNMSPHEFDFVIDAVSGANVGHIEGTASFFDKIAVYQDAETGCVIQFEPKNRCITVRTTEGCNDFGGMGVYFSGDYCKVSADNQISNVFIDTGIFNHNTLHTFKERVGHSYKLFPVGTEFFMDRDPNMFLR